MGKVKILLISIAAAFIAVGSANAMTIDWYDTNDATQAGYISDWISAQGGQVVLLEDFESMDRDWYQTLNSDLGVFEAGGARGSAKGTTSYNYNNATYSYDPYFSIRENSDHTSGDSDWSGRSNQTPGGNKWLDSGDITRIDLALEMAVTNLFFYIQDPGDVGLTTTIGAGNGSETIEISKGYFDNAEVFFVGIASDTPITSVWWETTLNQDGFGIDGFGLDDFSTVVPVPEPASIFLLGIGLLGFAGWGRKKIK